MNIRDPFTKEMLKAIKEELAIKNEDVVLVQFKKMQALYPDNLPENLSEFVHKTLHTTIRLKLDELSLFILNNFEIDVNNLERSLFKTYLHEAAETGNVDIAKHLIQLGANVNARNWHGWTPLYCAAFVKAADVVDLLLLCGANVYLRGKNEETALHAAIQGTTKNKALNERVLRSLLAADDSMINSKAESGGTALHYAAERADLEAVKALLDHGADVDIFNDYLRTPVEKAAAVGAIDCVNAFMSSDQRNEIDVERLVKFLPKTANLSSLNNELFKLYQQREKIEETSSEESNEELYAKMAK